MNGRPGRWQARPDAPPAPAGRGGRTRRRPVRDRHGAARAASIAAVALAALVAGAGPAAADPPRPTDYRSTVTAVTPRLDGVEAEIVGGDAFLELRVAEGHEVVVPGYGEDAEPYLRFRADGTVERNLRSEATYLNEDRQGAVDLPAQADREAEPEWETVADDGTYAWHDHRVHWMGSNRPPGAEPGDVVQSWTVPLTVDGEPVTVDGELVLVARVSPVPWILLGIAGAAAVVLLGRRRPLVPAAAVAMAAAGALLVGWAQFSAAPEGSGASPLLVAVPLIGLVAAGLGLAFRGRVTGPVATLAGAAAVVGWGVLRIDVLWMPVLPTDLPAGIDRAVTALSLGLAAAAAAVIVWSGGLTVRLPPAADAPSSGTGADRADEPDPEPTDDRTASEPPAPNADDAAATRGGGDPR